jgi:hypothetical protein
MTWKFRRGRREFLVSSSRQTPNVDREQRVCSVSLCMEKRTRAHGHTPTIAVNVIIHIATLNLVKWIRASSIASSRVLGREREGFASSSSSSSPRTRARERYAHAGADGLARTFTRSMNSFQNGKHASRPHSRAMSYELHTPINAPSPSVTHT